MKKLIFIMMMLPLLGFGQGNFFFNQHGAVVIVDTSTFINIIFDSSGSMNATLTPLQEMVDTYLQDSLIDYYNNDVDIYNRKVSITSISSERTFGADMLYSDIEVLRDNATNKIVTIVYQDEANPVYYATPFLSTAALLPSYSSDIANLRDSVSLYDGTLRYTGVIFQVDETSGAVNFKTFIEAVENGTNNYAGINGLSDKSSQFVYYYDITDGGAAVYYTNLFMAALRDLGFDI